MTSVWVAVIAIGEAVCLEQNLELNHEVNRNLCNKQS